MIKGFFFDLDGTLVNTYEADYLAYRDAIKKVLGVEVSQDDFTRTHGQEMRGKFVTLGLEVSEEDAQGIAALKKEAYKKYIDITEPNEQLIKFLAEFADHHAMVLVTTAKEENARHVLQKHDLEKYFSHTVFGEEVSRFKPDPEAYEIALKKSGLQPGDVLAFEDTDSGIKAAEAAGIAVVYVRTFAQ